VPAFLNGIRVMALVSGSSVSLGDVDNFSAYVHCILYGVQSYMSSVPTVSYGLVVCHSLAGCVQQEINEATFMKIIW
jgi:hypothetical protein